MTVTPDTELTLNCVGATAVVSPWGASLRRYFLQEADGRQTDILWGYSGSGQKKGGQGDVLIPFPGRIPDGRYTFEGETFQLERNDKEGPNAIHGFVRALPWDVSVIEPDRVTFTVHLDAAVYAARGFPFSLNVSVTYALSVSGLSCSFEVKNVGRKAAPVGIGFHPYFVMGSSAIDDCEVRIPASGLVEFNERLLPTGKINTVAGTEWDYRSFRPIGDRRFNHCYTQLDRNGDGTATAVLRHPRSGRAISIAMDGSWSAIVVYSGDAIAGHARRALAIEPMTCATDAFNHPEWGLTRLAVDESCAGRYSISPHYA
jgi:aldose 1-epimerase